MDMTDHKSFYLQRLDHLLKILCQISQLKTVEQEKYKKQQCRPKWGKDVQCTEVFNRVLCLSWQMEWQQGYLQESIQESHHLQQNSTCRAWIGAWRFEFDPNL